jgi:hypothetical protein
MMRRSESALSLPTCDTGSSRLAVKSLPGLAWLATRSDPVAKSPFVNGIVQPLVLYLQTGPVSMGLIAVMLLLILFPARARRWIWVVFVAVFAFWALAAEAGFVLFALAAVLAAVIVIVRHGGPAQRRTAMSLLGAVVLAGLLAVAQGGTLTEAARRVFAGGASGEAASSLAGFSLRETPAIVSSHLGEMRLTRPGELMIALFELGPALLFAPLAAWVLLRAARRHRVLLSAFAISTFLGLLSPILLRYEVDRDITRLTYYALMGWMLLAVIPLATAWSRGGAVVRGTIVVVTAALVFGGVTLAGPLLTAMPRAVFADGFLPADTAMTNLVWDRLEDDSLVVDSSSWRAVAVTGRLTRSARDSSTLLGTWEALVDDPFVDRLVRAGFDYAYVDRSWWNNMSEEERQSFRAACVREVAAVHDNGANGDRWLYDLRACPPE